MIVKTKQLSKLLSYQINKSFNNLLQNKNKTNNIFKSVHITNYSTKHFYTNSLSKANFYNDLSKEEKKNESIFDSIVSKIRNNMNGNNKLMNNNYFIDALSLYFKSANKSLKLDFEEMINVYFQNELNIRSLNEETLPRFLFCIAKVALDENKLKIIDEYLVEKVNDNSTTILTKLRIQDSFYYFNLYNNISFLHKSMKEINKFIERELNLFSTSELEILMVNILYLSDYLQEELIKPIFSSSKLLDIMTNKISKLAKCELSKNDVKLVISFPKVLRYYAPDLGVQYQKSLYTYLKSFEGDCFEFPHEIEVIICLLSNTVTYLSLEQHLVDIFIPYIHRNLASISRNIYIHEILFVILKLDYKNYKNIKKVEELMKDILLVIQADEKDYMNEYEKSSEYKESKFILEESKKLNESFELWKIHRKKSTTLKEEKFHVLFDDVIDKNINIYPFSCLKYTNEVFDWIFNNFSHLVKL